MGRRAHSITSRADFQRLFRQGRVEKTSHLAAHVADRPEEGLGRTAIIVSRKHGNAVRRNRTRRRIAESVRRLGGPPERVDVVLVARPGVEKLSSDRLNEEISQIMEGLKKRQVPAP